MKLASLSESFQGRPEMHTNKPNKKEMKTTRGSYGLMKVMSAAVLLSPLGASAQFNLIAGLDDVRNDAGNDRIQNFLSDGTDLLVALSGASIGGGQFEGHAINRVSGIGGTISVTNLMPSAGWGTGFFSPIHSFQLTSGGIQFGTTGAASVLGVHRFDLGTNTLSTRFSSTDITSLTGATGYSHLGASVTDGAGELYFANTNSSNRALYRTNGLGIDTLLDATELGTLFGGPSNPSINAMTLSGSSLLLANNSANVIASYDVGTDTGSLLLNDATILAITGGTSVTISRMFTAPDGTVFFSTSNRQVLSFDPSDAASTLQLVLTTGDSTPWNVQALGWYGDDLAFATTSGIYAVPEPSTYAAVLGALALAGILIRRRRA